jgi:tRNA pseudouridine55 synthase
MHGFVVIDKPAGITSHDVVAAVRRICKLKKVGHTGTLDPFATGVLPVAIGEGTKAIPFLDESVKMYRAVMRLGAVTDTQDCTGTILRTAPWQQVTLAAVQKLLPGFTGPITQIPPMYSAIKKDGVPLYRMARAGVSVEREPRQVTIHRIEIEQFSPPEITFTVSCSPGTYVRTIAEDLGELLGCGAHLTELRRTASGIFSLKEACSIPELQLQVESDRQGSWLMPLSVALGHMQQVALNEGGLRKVEKGISPKRADFADPLQEVCPGSRVQLTWQNQLLAVAEARDEKQCNDGKWLDLLRVFNVLYPLHDDTVVLNNKA